MNEQDSRAEDNPASDDEAMKQAAEALLKTFESAGYRILLQQFRRDADDALEDFVDVDPADTAAIIALQTRVKMFRQLLETPPELIRQGFQIEEYDELEAGQDAEIDMVDDQD